MKASRTSLVRRRWLALSLATAAVVASAAAASPAAAATFTVNSAADTGGTTCAGTCTLRQAIGAANADSVADVIEFTSTPVSVVINAPLLPLTQPVTIDGSGATTGSTSTVSGSSSYVTANCANPATYALDLTASAANGSRIRYLPFSNVCGRALKSALAPPTINIGPRRADGTLSVTGAAAGSIVDVYRADTPPNSGEAESFLTELSVPPTGVYSFVPSPELTAGQKLTATTTDLTTTSTFANRAQVPADITSPSLTGAVAITNSRVRIDFNEAIAPGSLAAGEFSLTMAGVSRPVTAVGVADKAVYLDTTLPWQSGESGAVALTGAGRVTDSTGNEVIGLPSAVVFAGPGELNPPVISSLRFSPSKFCQRKSAACTRGTTSVYLTLNKPCRVVFTVIRGKRARTLVSFVRRLKQGRNRFKFDAVVSGRTLPASTLGLRAYAEDATRTRSDLVDAAFRVVKHRREL